METQTNYTTSSNTLSEYSEEETSYTTILSAPPKRRAGRTKFQETRHPTFKGVRRRNTNRWVCEVREPNKKSRIWLGTFPTAEMAARAHDVAAIALRGQSACLNFADSAWLLPVPKSNSRSDIQRAAVLAAELCRPQSSEMQAGVVSDYKFRTGQEEISSAVSRSDAFLFVDEMQGYFDDMAQGMLIDPPPPMMTFSDDFEGENDCEMSLWSHSI